MAERKTHLDALAVFALISASLLMGLNQALVKLVNVGFSPIFQSGLRSACAFLPILLFAIFMKRDLTITGNFLRWGLLNGLFFTAEFALVFAALDYTTVARVSLFFYIMPIWVALGAHFLVEGELLNRHKIAGLILAVAGVALALSGDLGEAGEDAWLGDLLALGGGICWAGVALVTRIKLEGVSIELNLLYQLVVSALVLMLVAPLFGPVIREPSLFIYGVFAFQVIVVMVIGGLVWFWVLANYPVSNMASFGLLAPVFGVFSGWLLFDDPITWVLTLALLMAGAGIVLVNRR